VADQLQPLPCEVARPATNFGIIWLARRMLDATTKALIERMKAADEAAFQHAQCLPPAFLARQHAGYAVPGTRCAPASPPSTAGE
jgi:hypothetical protein